MGVEFDPLHVVWLLVLGAAAVVAAFGFRSGDWIHPASSANITQLDVECGPFVYCIDDTCRKYDPQENEIWEASMWLMVLGIFFAFVAVLGAIVTICAQSWQPLAHNISMFGSVLTLVGLITFAFGFDDTRASRTEFAPCNFCGESTSVAQIEDCELGAGIIMMIVAVVGFFIAGILGWTVNQRGGAPDVYKERSYTGRRKKSHESFRQPTKPAAPGEGGDDKWQKNSAAEKKENATVSNAAFPGGDNPGGDNV